jgi:hypothetical protein
VRFRRCESAVDAEGRAAGPAEAIDTCGWIDGSERLSAEAPVGTWLCPNCGGSDFELVDADDPQTGAALWDQRLLERGR